MLVSAEQRVIQAHQLKQGVVRALTLYVQALAHELCHIFIHGSIWHHCWRKTRVFSGLRAEELQLPEADQSYLLQELDYFSPDVSEGTLPGIKEGVAAVLKKQNKKSLCVCNKAGELRSDSRGGGGIISCCIPLWLWYSMSAPALI